MHMKSLTRLCLDTWGGTCFYFELGAVNYKASVNFTVQ
jgi:hypothetical protein